MTADSQEYWITFGSFNNYMWLFDRMRVGAMCMCSMVTYGSKTVWGVGMGSASRMPIYWSSIVGTLVWNLLLEC